jgi:hypothetical protein
MYNPAQSICYRGALRLYTEPCLNGTDGGLDRRILPGIQSRIGNDLALKGPWCVANQSNNPTTPRA